MVQSFSGFVHCKQTSSLQIFEIMYPILQRWTNLNVFESTIHTF
eukprot:03462.XXX_144922_145053_1 [CDS] Oithona nana genome sequencing.